MKILIVEDEPVHARYLSGHLESILGKEIESLQHQKTLTAGECFLLENAIDLVFLDLNLYGESGFELLNGMSGASFETIVVSAHEDLAVRAFEYGVLDFLPKPVVPHRLSRALQRYRDNRYASRRVLRYFSYTDRGSVETVPLADINYFMAAGKHLIIHDCRGERRSCTRRIGDVERILPSNFRRIHKSYIVNTNVISSLRLFPGGRYRLSLKDGTTLPVSRSAYAEIRDLLLSGD